MLYFYNNSDKLGETIENALANMSSAHKKVKIEGETSFLIEDLKVIKGEKDVIAFLNSYGKLLSSHQLVTGDSCYVDSETGQSCMI